MVAAVVQAPASESPMSLIGFARWLAVDATRTLSAIAAAMLTELRALDVRR